MDAAIAPPSSTTPPLSPTAPPVRSAVAAAAASWGAPAAEPAAKQAAFAALPVTTLMEQAQALQAGGRAADAAALYAGWLAAHPGHAHRHIVCFNHGTVLSGLQREAEAEQAYQAALEAAPGFAPALLNLGHLLERRGATAEALAQWQAVYDAEPAPALDHRLHALNNSARLQEILRRYPEAEALMRRSLELKAAQTDVIQHYVHIRQKQCAWPHDLAVGEVTPNQFLTGTSLLATMGLSDDPTLQLLSATRFVHEKVAKPPAVPLYLQAPVRDFKAEPRIRIGYLSGDLHMHAVGLLTAELFELHDRQRVEVWAFDWTPESAFAQRQRLIRSWDHHVRIGGVDDLPAARLIAQAGIDVLVDLQGLTNGARPGILVQRPAPVQVSYLGLPGTSAVPGVDWMLADRYVMPPELRPYCTEKPIYLPHCYQVSDRQREVGPMPTRAQYGLPEDAFVYCSFNNNHKFTPEMFDAWMAILRRVPNSVLWLLADNEVSHANLLREAARRGIGPERLVFAGRVAPPDYLARFQVADVMLDTFPFNAGTTASDALWMGLPIVTRSGRTYISRMAGSLLHAIGLPDLVTENVPDYIDRAVTLGLNPARVASYKRYLAEHGRSSPLFDLPATVRAIEDRFETLALQARAARAAGQVFSGPAELA